MAFTYKAYQESNAVKNAKKLADQNSKYTQSKDVSLAKTALDKHEKTKVADWTGGTYGESVKQAMDKINNREKFSYDLAGDALYQQYKDQYINLGKMAMADTVGQAASLTGGYANSYAATAGNQAYQNYLTQLNDVVPELYQMAADRYDQEGNELYRQLDMYNQAYGTEYGEYRDQVSDWYNEDERLSSRYYNEANMDWNRFADNRDYYTSAYRDIRDYQRDLYDSAYNKALEQYKQKVAEQQWQKEYELKKYSASSSGGGGGGGRSSGGKNYNPTPTPTPTPQQSIDLMRDIVNPAVKGGTKSYAQVCREIDATSATASQKAAAKAAAFAAKKDGGLK